jgi:hypothetical protein
MDKIKDGHSKMTKSIKRILVVSIIVASLLIAFFATTNADTSSSGSQNTPLCIGNTDSFTTTVVGVVTNAVYTPIILDGHSFTSTNIANYIALSFGTPSKVSISASNFVPEDYVQFAVTITNTGTDTLAFQPFSITIGYPSPTSTVNKPWTSANFGTDTLSTYLSHLDVSANWVTDFSYTGISAFPTTLAPRATFTYNLFVGLGGNVPYGIPGLYFSLNIPLSSQPTPTPSPCPTPTPKPTPCPTPTPKPTCTPTPTATPKPTPCPTPTPKPTPTPTSTPKPTPCPTATPKPTPTPTPKPTTCPTPKPTPKPTQRPR